MRVPTATYRIQFHPNFKFVDAEGLIPYLQDLGVSHLYSSPPVKARRGSQHGYDVADPLHINAELGTEQEVNRLVERLHQHGMGLLLDIVPNHMAASRGKSLVDGRARKWPRVRLRVFLRHRLGGAGSKSPEVQKNHIVLPILTDLYDRVLTTNDRLRIDEKGFYIQAEDNRLPINPKTYAPILEAASVFCPLRPPKSRRPTKSGAFSRKCVPSQPEGLMHDLRSSTSSGRHTSRSRRFERLSTRQWALSTARRATQHPSPIFESLLSIQAYRMAFWRTSTEEVNYRRFFGLNDLVALREEDPKVFDSVHVLIFRLIAENKVSGSAGGSH